MNKKSRFRYFILPAVIISAAALLFLCVYFYQKAGGAAIMTDTASVSDSNSSSKPDKTPVTEYIAASELMDDASVTAALQAEVKTNPCTDLSVPTYITKVNDTYFLVDCYHNQVIYHDNIQAPLYEWHVMTDEITMGHTLASDGTVYLVDDTENNRVLIFEKIDGRFVHTQTFSDIGNRPHYIIYDENTDTFYAWSSMNGEMYLFRRNADEPRVYLTEVRKVDCLSDVYVRSFTILDDEIYFVSGNSHIIRADLHTFEILKSYPVPDTMAGMIQLTKIQDYFYLTISTDIAGNQDYATIIRVKKLSNLMKGKYEDIYESFIGGGTPYYITSFDDAYYLTEHRLPGHCVWRFQVVDNKLQNIETIY